MTHNKGPQVRIEPRLLPRTQPTWRGNALLGELEVGPTLVVIKRAI